MPKYEVLHSHIMTPTGNHARGKVLSAADFKSIGLPLDFLLQNGTIGVLRGSENEKDTAAETVLNAIADGTVNPVSGGSPAPLMDSGTGGELTADATPETLPITTQTVKEAKAVK